MLLYILRINKYFLNTMLDEYEFLKLNINLIKRLIFISFL